MKLGDHEVHVWLAFDGEFADATLLANLARMLEPHERELAARRIDALAGQYVLKWNRANGASPAALEASLSLQRNSRAISSTSISVIPRAWWSWRSDAGRRWESMRSASRSSERHSK